MGTIKNSPVWEIMYKISKKESSLSIDEIITILLKNRGIKRKSQRDEYFSPTHPGDLSLNSLGIKKTEIKKAISRLEKAKKAKEKIIIFGDYDADGICATAILWDNLHRLGFDVLRYIPNRFSEGYGISPESVVKLVKKCPGLGLIITVDNGIVAKKAIKDAKKNKVDVIITDHHESEKTVPSAHSIIHTTKTGGAVISWLFAREIVEHFKPGTKLSGLELAAIGTISDVLPLLGINRSFVTHGLKRLNRTKNLGLNSLFKVARLKKGSVGVYEVGFMLAPRINAMGRLKRGRESLQLLCTKSEKEAKDLSEELNKTNIERQKIVEDAIAHAKLIASKKDWQGVVLISHKQYHEGVIGLVAAKLVQEYYLPSIVISEGEVMSKASARSIPGFSIIDAIRAHNHLVEGGGGHTMAAGFSIKTNKIEIFEKKIGDYSAKLLDDKLLKRKLRVDLEIGFNKINRKLVSKLNDFEPTGIGNPAPTFATYDVQVLESRVVGRDSKHIKLVLTKDDVVFEAIAFGFGDYYSKLLPQSTIDVLYTIEENIWRGKRSIQLKIKDIKPKNYGKK